MELDSYTYYSNLLIEKVFGFYFQTLGISYTPGEEIRTLHFENLASALEDFLSTHLQSRQKILLGITVSASTLKRMYKKEFVLKNMDRRKLNSLDKLSIYLGYRDFQDFSIHNKKLAEPASSSILPDPGLINGLITDFLNAELRAYIQIPLVSPDHFDATVHPAGTLRPELFARLNRLVLNGWIIDQSIYPAYYNLYEIRMGKISGGKLVVGTLENWVLNWVDKNTRQRTLHYNETNYQLYHICLENGHYTLYSNTYPVDQKIYAQLMEI